LAFETCGDARVLAAITVTSFSLSQIAWKTFDIRTAEATAASQKLAEVKTRRDDLQNKIVQFQHERDQKIADRNIISDRLTGLQQQLTKLSTASGQACKPLIGSDGRVLVGEDGKPIQSCSPVTSVNSAQLGLLKTQIANTQKELESAQATVKLADDDLKAIDPQKIQAEYVNAEAEFRAAVNQSQLYSYAGMLTGKAGADVTEADVKRLEKYLILIFSIAAAFASTLLAVTAVRRLKRPVPNAITAIPDEAAKYLFGPLLEAIKKEAKDAVEAAIKERSRTTAGRENVTV
jgi:hypothetical protein